MWPCGTPGAFDLGDACVRQSWATLTPLFAVVLVVSVGSKRSPLRSWRFPSRFNGLFFTFLTLEESEALVDAANTKGEVTPGRGEQADRRRKRVVVWRSMILAFGGLVESLGWVAAAAICLLRSQSKLLLTEPAAVHLYLTAVSWVYATARPIAAPPATVPYDLFTLYVLHAAGGLLLLGGLLFEYVVGVAPLPRTLVLVGLSVNLVIIFVLLVVVVQMPNNVPSERVDEGEIGRSVSPEDYTTLWQWITFDWVYPLIKVGTKGTLQESDVWGLSPTMQSRPVFIKFQTLPPGASLLLRLFIANSQDLLLDGIGTWIAVVLEYAGPFFLKRLLDLLDQPDVSREDRGTAYVYAGAMFLASLLKSQASLNNLWFCRRAVLRIRSQLMAAIYDKALKRKDYSALINSDSKEQEGATKSASDTGKINNMMANDAENISLYVSICFILYTAPFQIAIGAYLLYQTLGWSAFTGFAAFFACWPLSDYLTKQGYKIGQERSKATDKRMAVVDELIGSVKFIKFFAWEEQWIGRVLSARAEELRWLAKTRMNSIFFSGLWIFVPVSLSLTSFLVYVWIGNELTAGKAFTAIALFTMIRQPLNAFPSQIVQFVQAGVALNRIAVYLQEDEVSEQVSSLKHGSEPTDGETGLGLVGATLQWNSVESETTPIQSAASSVTDLHTVVGDSAARKFELSDVTVRFPEGKLTVVTGPTASGKTALLMALMGEMTLLPGGKVVLSKSSAVDEHGFVHGIAYAAQAPWLQHRTIRDNILFGSPMDEGRYKQVVHCCALQPDFDMLEDGDETEIGLKGVSLSGGQKARVALARVVYSRKKYVLLDDPLSAVDSHTARFLYENCLLGPLLANRTVILVTHHVDLVAPGAHYLVRMLDGRIDVQGTVQDLRSQGVLQEIEDEEAVEVAEHEDEVSAEAPDAALGEEPAKKPRKLVEDEKRETGSVKWSVYQEYLAASRYSNWIILAVLVILQQLSGVSEKLWIKIWADAYGGPSELPASTFVLQAPGEQQHIILTRSIGAAQTLPNASASPFFYIAIYAAIGLCGIVLQVSTIALQLSAALTASRVLFERLLVQVVRATFRFHDTTPQGLFPTGCSLDVTDNRKSGRMLNRFSNDFAAIDTRLAGSLQAVNSSLSGFIVAVITVAVVFPPYILPAVVIAYLYQRLAVGYINTGRDLRRIQANYRSPIFSNFGEVLSGIVTVRAFSAEERFMDSLHAQVDKMTEVWYAFWMTNRWLLLNFDFLVLTSTEAVFTTSLFAIAMLDNDAGLAGLAITSALNFTQSVYWACRFWTMLELDLNSVERIIEYMDLPQEPTAVIEANRPPAYWPSSTTKNALVVAENVEVRYSAELPAVLKDVSFEFRAGERIGLVGRTGSGKSTLAMSLLRFVDPSSGRILIDGIDTSTIGLHDLRSRVVFIPQDATLFSGTLRDNLDPFGELEDSVCLDALRRVHLIGDDSGSKIPVPPPPSSSPALALDTAVSAGGSNFSSGQRQLIAMARALLRQSAIVIMDEATSSVDFATDAKMQETIRSEFGGALLITVAHRLKTIIDYDRLLVLDNGRVVEFDTPSKLMQKPDGVFRGMCLKSGTFAELEAIAKAKAASAA
ncbi:unnamed protein product [Mycena citricolor]|uniref:Uncharacterized protein n=1 Tax=Mycena citricolor TaxID=2018698 RepID=A0AAD2HSS4_9AGAR|nr:unnamed protein product [Mycena citricolor]